MTPFTSILVDIDASAPAHPALDRAVRLARACDAKLTIADVVTIPGEARRLLQPTMEDEIVSRRRRQLDRIAADVGADATLLSGRPATAIIREVLRAGHDLLVRSHVRDLVAPRSFGAVDMELFRKCPCPVFVVGPGAPPAHPQILGAVHPSTEEPTERALNAKIVELTLLMARLEQGSASLVQAWAPFAERLVRGHVSDEEFFGHLERERHLTMEDLDHLTRQFGDRLSGVPALLQRGEPEDVIPELVVAKGIDLVVMGTVARTGIAGLLIGNTAERLLRKLPCSVLAVKPDGFESPVRLDDRT